MLAITGATGRIGLRLVHTLVKRKERFICIVRSSESAKKLPAGVKFRIASQENVEGLADALKGADIVVNLAGSTDTRLSAHRLHLANAVSASHVFHSLPYSTRRVVHISSIAVYGKRPRPILCNEHHHASPDTPYAKSKWAGERVASEHAVRFPVTVLRPAIVYGPSFEEGFFPLLRGIESGSLKIIGSGANHIPLVHVDDLVRAILLSIKSEKAGLSIYNISSPPQKTPTQHGLFALAAKMLGKKAPSQQISYPAAKFAIGVRAALLPLFGRRASLTPEMIDQIASDRLFDTSAAQRSLGWSPRIGLKAGIKQTINGYKHLKKAGKNHKQTAEIHIRQ